MKTTFCYEINEKAKRVKDKDGKYHKAYLKIVVKSLGETTPEEYARAHMELIEFVEYVTKIKLEYILPISKLDFFNNVDENNKMEILEVFI